MKLVYTHANRTMVCNVQNIVDQAGFETVLRNEYAIGAIGEISPFENWLELWVINDADHAAVKKLIEEAQSQLNAPPWKCNGCAEDNDPSFEFCWNCGRDKDV